MEKQFEDLRDKYMEGKLKFSIADVLEHFVSYELPKGASRYETKYEYIPTPTTLTPLTRFDSVYQFKSKQGMDSFGKRRQMSVRTRTNITHRRFNRHRVRHTFRRGNDFMIPRFAKPNL